MRGAWLLVFCGGCWLLAGDDDGELPADAEAVDAEPYPDAGPCTWNTPETIAQVAASIAPDPLPRAVVTTGFSDGVYIFYGVESGGFHGASYEDGGPWLVTPLGGVGPDRLRAVRANAVPQAVGDGAFYMARDGNDWVTATVPAPYGSVCADIGVDGDIPHLAMVTSGGDLYYARKLVGPWDVEFTDYGTVLGCPAFTLAVGDDPTMVWRDANRPGQLVMRSAVDPSSTLWDDVDLPVDDEPGELVVLSDLSPAGIISYVMVGPTLWVGDRDNVWTMVRSFGGSGHYLTGNFPWGLEISWHEDGYVRAARYDADADTWDDVEVAAVPAIAGFTSIANGRARHVTWLEPDGAGLSLRHAVEQCPF
jgi:hypothetical protein